MGKDVQCACGRRAKAVAARAVQVVALLHAVCKQEKRQQENWLGTSGRVSVLAMKLTERVGAFHAPVGEPVAVGVLRSVEQHAWPPWAAFRLHG